MAGLKTPNSPNIAVWDSRVIGDTCAEKFIVDATPSTFIGAGASSVLGAKVKIVNPWGVTIKDYTASYDIAAPFSVAYELDIPKQAGQLQYGVYMVSLKAVDSDNTEYEITKPLDVCSYTSDSHPCDKRMRIKADCKNGVVKVSVAEPPIFKGKYAESRTQEWTINYPTASGLPPETTDQGNFALQAFQGVYLIEGSVCATYNMGDNVYLRLTYEESQEKNVKCLLDYTCIWPGIKKLNDKIDAGCSQKDKELYSSMILDALRLLTTAELANDAGEDASKYIDELEKLLGCPCRCDCGASPIINGNPSTNVLIEGCLVEKTTVGVTDVYTIGGRSYFVTEDDTQNVIHFSSVNEYGCVAYQQLFYNSGNAYTAMKGHISNITEYNYWAGVINNALGDLVATCLGYNTSQWAALTLAQKIQAIINMACAGGSCTTTISAHSAARSGTDVVISWTQALGFNAEVYVDNILVGIAMTGTNAITVPGKADGNSHTYTIVPKCQNGSQGTPVAGSFQFIGCPSIAPPILTDTNVSNVSCPYDLTNLVYPSPPLGITVEWHNQNNTNNISLVPDPSNVSSGVYYAFAKDSNGCYSAASAVTVICGLDACTAPQGLLVVEQFGGNYVTFQSASAPPPSNSYTVKRKAAGDPDVDGSYTTIGTPTFNSTTNRWEIVDNTATDNTLYTYKAQSNCSASTPYVLYTFASLECPTLAFTPGDDTMDYEFTDVGGEVDKYEVSIYNSSGSVLIATHTITPAFSNPITGQFTYLDEGTIYKIGVKVFIGSYSKTCTLSEVLTTGGDNFVLSASWNMSIDSATGTGVPALPPTGLNGTQQGQHSGITGDITVTLSGSLVVTTALTLYVDEVLVDCKQVSGAGVYVFNGTSIASNQSVRISINNYTC